MRGVGVQLANIIKEHASTPDQEETLTTCDMEESPDRPLPISLSAAVAMDCEDADDPKDVLRPSSRPRGAQWMPKESCFEARTAYTSYWEIHLPSNESSQMSSNGCRSWD